MIDIGLYIGYGLLIATLSFAIVMPLFNALKSPGELTKMLTVAAILLCLFFVSFLLSGSEVTAEYIAQGINEGASKRIGSGLIMFYIVFLCALVGVAVSEITRIIR